MKCYYCFLHGESGCEHPKCENNDMCCFACKKEGCFITRLLQQDWMKQLSALQQKLSDERQAKEQAEAQAAVMRKALQEIAQDITSGKDWAQMALERQIIARKALE